MKALALPRLVVRVRPLCSRGSANVVEEGAPDSGFSTCGPGQGCSLGRPGIPPTFFWRDSSESLRVAAQASRHTARPTLDFPTWSFATARRTELKRWTLSPSDKGADENSSIISSTTAENEFQSTFLVFQRALRRDAETAGTSHRQQLSLPTDLSASHPVLSRQWREWFTTVYTT